MARSDVDRLVSDAMKALMAPREDSIRAVAQAVSDLATTDEKITQLLAERDKLVLAADDAVKAAKAAGWKPRELTDAGLTVVRAYAPPRPPKRSEDAPPAQ
jgi:hypothetical protein